MKTASILRFAIAFVMAGAMAAASAQDRPKDAGRNQPSHNESHNESRGESRAPSQGILRLLPADSVTEHSVDTPNGKLSYTATAGTLSFYDQSGSESAKVFYTAYVAKDANRNGGGKAGSRPITFAFNGGPGAASAFLNLGLVGPRILSLGPNGHDAARAQLHDNPQTWLAFTDLVLIDPIGTGWSRAAKADDAKNFWNVQSDAGAMAKAVALYIAHHDRAASPKYLLGESYGGLRAVKTTRALQRDQGIAVNGIVMLSPLLEGWLTFGDDTSALRAALTLPSLAAAELERNKTFNLENLLAAEKFAMTDYLTTLSVRPPQGAAGAAFYRKVAKISGLPEATVEKTRGFVAQAYVKNLRAGKIVSQYDATFTVDDPAPERSGERSGDPILDGVARAYGGAFADYARNELGFKTEMTYALLANDVTRGWDWHGGRFAASADDDIRTLLSFSPSFRLMIAHGYSDMVTPYGMTRYLIDHLPPIGPPGRVQLALYRGGHMFYIDPDSRRAFSADAAAFYRNGE
ncbi:MAG: carboxypeptidase [Rhodopseudomonas sp.]|nr:carboxypeptidase [Rhodopseudomonas sp.]